MTRILITGARGFVGRAVCKSLRVAGYSLSGTTSNIEQKRGPENIPLYYIPEIGPDTDWSGSVAGADAIIHLEARVPVPRDTSSDPLAEHRRVNRDGTRQLAIAAAAAGVNRLVFISTIKVNGEITKGLIDLGCQNIIVSRSTTCLMIFTTKLYRWLQKGGIGFQNMSRG